MSEPIRTCIGCSRRQERSRLIRFTVDDGRLVEGDGRGGRGAWLCRDHLGRCFEQATEGRRWARALRSQIDPGSLTALCSRVLDVPAGNWLIGAPLSHRSWPA